MSNSSDLFSPISSEDSQVEVLLAQEFQRKKGLFYAGNGFRSLSSLSANFDHISIFSRQVSELYLIELQAETYRKLSYQDFLFFWGLPPYGERRRGRKRERLFLQFELTADAKNTFMDLYSERSWEPLQLTGLVSDPFVKLHQVIRLTLGKEYDEIFKFDSLKEQRDFYEKGFPHKKWKLALKLLSNSEILNKFLSPQGRSLKSLQSPYEFFEQTFDHLFKSGLARENFFLQLCFYGRVIYSEGLPYEAQRETFHKIKKHLEQPDSLTLLCESDLEHFNTQRYDYISLGNAYSDKEELVHEIDQKFTHLLSDDGLLSHRVSFNSQVSRLRKLRNITKKNSSLIKKDKTPMHRFSLYQKSPSKVH